MSVTRPKATLGSRQAETHRRFAPAPPTSSQVEASLRRLAGQRVAIALSGGVDSAAAAHALVEAGADVIGLSLRLHDAPPDNPLAPRACCAPDDLQDARHIAETLDIPFYLIDARETFEAGVVRPFVDAYLSGTTPNPCVGCNSRVKLGMLVRRAAALGCMHVATGHYARLATGADGRVHLYAGVDSAKDQSYFLFGTTPKVLDRLVFPLGAMRKTQVRHRAMAAGLPVANKLDSQEVCFVGGSGAGAYVRGRPEAAGDRRGEIVGIDGAVLGEHAGVSDFTIGQRRGLGLGTHKKLYVLAIDGPSKRVVVGDDHGLQRCALTARDVRWPAGSPMEPVSAAVKIRYRDRGTVARITPLSHSRVHVEFDQPVRAVAPGQAAVFYDGEEVLGGAWIVAGTS